MLSLTESVNTSSTSSESLSSSSEFTKTSMINNESDPDVDSNFGQLSKSVAKSRWNPAPVELVDAVLEARANEKRTDIYTALASAVCDYEQAHYSTPTITHISLIPTCKILNDVTAFFEAWESRKTIPVDVYSVDSLDELEYAALTYRWGSTKDNRWIKDFLNAVKGLRSQFIWIDWACAGHGELAAWGELTNWVYQNCTEWIFLPSYDESHSLRRIWVAAEVSVVLHHSGASILVNDSGVPILKRLSQPSDDVRNGQKEYDDHISKSELALLCKLAVGDAKNRESGKSGALFKYLMGHHVVPSNHLSEGAIRLLDQLMVRYDLLEISHTPRKFRAAVLRTADSLGIDIEGLKESESGCNHCEALLCTSRLIRFVSKKDSISWYEIVGKPELQDAADRVQVRLRWLEKLLNGSMVLHFEASSVVDYAVCILTVGGGVKRCGRLQDVERVVKFLNDRFKVVHNGVAFTVTNRNSAGAIDCWHPLPEGRGKTRKAIVTDICCHWESLSYMPSDFIQLTMDVTTDVDNSRILRMGEVLWERLTDKENYSSPSVTVHNNLLKLLINHAIISRDTGARSVWLFLGIGQRSIDDVVYFQNAILIENGENRAHIMSAGVLRTEIAREKGICEDLLGALAAEGLGVRMTTKHRLANHQLL